MGNFGFNPQGGIPFWASETSGRMCRMPVLVPFWPYSLMVRTQGFQPWGVWFNSS